MRIDLDPEAAQDMLDQLQEAVRGVTIRNVGKDNRAHAN
jgi:hypothetical protein